MLGTFITFPEDLTTSTLGVAGTIFSDFWPLVSIIVITLLAITVIGLVIKMFHK